MHWWALDAWRSGGAVALISWVFWVIFSITLHELAHGWAALWQGDDTPRRLHRMTGNPLVHMGTTSLLMFAILGIAWGVMPVEPSKFRWKRRGRAFVAAAGPAMNILLGLVCVHGLIVWLRVGPAGQPIHDNLLVFLETGLYLNILLVVINLIPLPPFDGAQIVMGFSFRAWRLYQHPQADMFGLFVVLAVFLSGIHGLIAAPIIGAAGWYVSLF